MSEEQPPIRIATAADAPAVSECVNASYRPYVERIGKPPGPMLDDYAEVIREHSVYVIDGETGGEAGEDRGGSMLGLLVLIEKVDGLLLDGLLLDNVAVHPSAQGRGVGRRLMSHAESVAHERGYEKIYLYTHELMVENIALYQRLGYVEFERRVENGLRRVYMMKAI